MRSTILGAALKLAVGLAITVVIFAAVEAALRAAGFEHHPPSPIRIWNPRMDQGLQRSEGMYRFHPYWFWEPRPRVAVADCPDERINAAGYRGAQRARERRPDTLRIVTLGDSSTFGMGVCSRDSYPAVLERLLPESEVLNFGVVGFSAFQGEKLLAGRALAYRPALILAAFGAVDEQFPAHPDVDAKFAITSRVSPWAAEWRDRLHPLRLFQLMERALATGAAPTAVEQQRAFFNYSRWAKGAPNYVRNQSLPSFKRSLEAIVTHARAHGTRVALIAPPRRRAVETRWPAVEGYSAAIAETASRLGVPCWDVRAVFRAIPDADSTLFLDNYHPNAAGHVVYATFLAEQIRQLTAADAPPAHSPARGMAPAETR